MKTHREPIIQGRPLSKVQINLRLTHEDLRIIQDRANKYAGANRSLYIREAALKYVPTKKKD